MWYYRSQRDDGEVIDKLTELAEAKPNQGFDWLYNRIIPILSLSGDWW